MTLREIIKKHRAEVDAHVLRRVPNLRRPLTDADREQWIMNDEALYRWAKQKGARI